MTPQEKLKEIEDFLFNIGVIGSELLWPILRVKQLEKALEFYSTLDYHPANMEGNRNELVTFGTHARTVLKAMP